MKSLDKFPLRHASGSRRKSAEAGISVEVMTDQSNTIMMLDCSCCEELLSSRLPGGVLIPIASTLKTFFKSMGMRNIDVRVSGSTMIRTYRGVIDKSQIPEMRKLLEIAVSDFAKKRRP
ncbi:MAG: hypothetical protein JSW61_06365 [Candidatus Thorarchaeota archaeon]|nr:MAG: hypothetical protein JSW61_06365 [Candidatus Thorarchaeota archaeon]